MSPDTRPTIVIADDNPDVVDVHVEWLSANYEILTATGGEAALKAIDESVDVVLLDRRMPDLSGDAVLDRLRARGFDGMVAMITAVKPEEDIVGLPFDDYVCKPVKRAELEQTVSSLLQRAKYNRQRQRCYRLATKLALLETSISQSRLEANPDYRKLKAQLTNARAEAHQTLESMIETETDPLAYADIG